MRGPNGEELPGAVLFACTLNSVRSPMAAALMRHLFGKFVYVDSAGARAGDLDPMAVEVMEEVGVTLSDLRYFGSQPWPFGRSLMVGFTARYAGGDICCDPKEIADARWFRPDALPDLPAKLSIAHALITDWVERSKR